MAIGYNTGSGISGAAGGAIQGGMMGGPWGAVIGGGLGALSGLMNKGKKPVLDPYGLYTPEQRQLMQGLGPYFTGNLNNNYNYTGDLNAPITNGEQDVVNNSARLNAVAGNTYSNLGNYNDANFNTQFNSEIQDPTIANFKNNIEPLLGEELPSFGTARANVVARGLGDLQGNLMQQRYAARESAKDRALNALSGANSYYQGAAGIQAIPREIQQAGLDRQYQNFVTGNQQKQDSINSMLQFLGMGSQATYTPGTPDKPFFGGAGGNLGGGVNFGSGGGGSDMLSALIGLLNRGGGNQGTGYGGTNTNVLLNR